MRAVSLRRFVACRHGQGAGSAESLERRNFLNFAARRGALPFVLACRGTFALSAAA